MKNPIIFTVVIFVLIVGAFIYFINRLTGIYPPIKNYVYKGQETQLLKLFKEYSTTHPNLNVQITDTTGDNSSGNKYYISLSIKNSKQNLKYSFNCETPPGENITIIKLTSAFDFKNKTGGELNDSPGIKPLIKCFERFLLNFSIYSNAEINERGA